VAALSSKPASSFVESRRSSYKLLGHLTSRDRHDIAVADEMI
jgi:hypothetical protein